MQSSTGRSRALAAAAVGRQACGTGDCRRHFARNRAADTEKNELKPWLKQQYCLPDEPSGEFVYHMEDVLDVYTRPYDPRRSQVCLDETTVQLIGEKRTPVPMAARRPARFDMSMNARGSAPCSCSTSPCEVGGRSSCLINARPSTSRMSSSTWWRCISHTPTVSCW